MFDETVCQTPTGYHAQLIAERKARKARIAAAAVVDEGIDLKRKPRMLVKTLPEPAAPLPFECAAWLVAEYVSDHPPDKQLQRPPIALIIKLTAAHFNITRDEICSDRREWLLVRPRHVAMYIARKLTLRSTPYIGRHFGGRDHSTICNAIANITKLRTTDESIAIAINAISTILAADGFDVSPLQEVTT